MIIKLICIIEDESIKERFALLGVIFLLSFAPQMEETIVFCLRCKAQ